MKLIKFEIGEGGIYAYMEDKLQDAKVFYDRKGKKKIFCDLHKRTQLNITLADDFGISVNDYDIPHCPRCVKLKVKQFPDIPESNDIRIPYIEGLK